MSTPSFETTRREFIAATCAACGAGQFALADRRPRINYVGVEDAPPVEQFVTTACPMCPGGCGLEVRVVRECAVGVRGNKSHPINRGGLCPRGLAVLQDFYHPDRLLGPLQRAGARGDGQWRPIEWKDAIAQIVDKLKVIRGGPGPHTLLTLLGSDRGLRRTAWRRFMRAFGSPNLIDAAPMANLAGPPAIRAMHGVGQRIGYDLAKAAYVLSFASQWLDAHFSATQASRSFAEFRRSRAGLRPRWVHMEARLSVTGAKANEWVPIQPGTEGALALGIAHVIVREGLYDREFVTQRCHGFEDWTDPTGAARLGFRRLVLEEYPPAKVQQITGAPEGVIFRLAREFCRYRPAVAIGYDDDGCGTQRCYDRMAIHSLNALVGSIDVPGGVTIFGEMTLLEADQPVDEVAARGLEQPPLNGPISERRLGGDGVDLLAATIGQSASPYAAEALFLDGANPVFSNPEGARFAEGLLRVPLLVSFASFVDDTNRYADLILPGFHGLERWDFDLSHTLSGHPVFSVAQPVIAPPDSLRHPYDVLRAIAEGVGETVGRSLPWDGPLEAVQAAAREVFETGRGASFGPAHEEAWAQLLESRGWRAPFAETFEAFWQDVLVGGGWTDPIYFHEEWDRVFKAPARRFAFHSEVLRDSFAQHPPAGDGTERRFLPNFEPLPEDPSRRFPLRLYVYALPALAHMPTAHLPWLNDISGAYMMRQWDTWVELHPETAEELGIHDGERVVVSTSRGSQELSAKVVEGVMPGVLAVPFGFGHEHDGRWVARGGVNPARIVTPMHDSLSGTSFWNATRAALAKV